MKVKQWSTRTSWKDSTGLVVPLLLVCDVSAASYSFFSPYRYFILLRQTAWAQAEEYFRRRLQRKQSEHINLSAHMPYGGLELTNLDSAACLVRALRRHLQAEILECPSEELLVGRRWGFLSLVARPHCHPSVTSSLCIKMVKLLKVFLMSADRSCLHL